MEKALDEDAEADTTQHYPDLLSLLLRGLNGRRLPSFCYWYLSFGAAAAAAAGASCEVSDTCVVHVACTLACRAEHYQTVVDRGDDDGDDELDRQAQDLLCDKDDHCTEALLVT